jgi:Ca2+-binding RTX toxin-like protein
MYILDSAGPVLAATGAAVAAGADVILGGAGADYAEGDAGMDLYQYGAGTRFFIAPDADAERRCGAAA